MYICCAARRRAELLRIGKAQLDRLESMRKLFTKSRALSLAQRALLYAKDELEMCTMRMRVRCLLGMIWTPQMACAIFAESSAPLRHLSREIMSFPANLHCSRSLLLSIL